MPFIEGTIRLRIASYDLTITRFISKTYPRVKPNFDETAESQSGTVVLSGVSYSIKHFWNIECKLNETDFNTFDAMHQYATENKLEVAIDDYTQEITEVARSRALATDATSANDGTQDRYYAKFNALFNNDVAKVKVGSDVNCSFQLRETSKTSP